MVGEQNIRNVLAALAICRGAGLEFSQFIKGVGSLQGLPHRCERVAETGGVSFINDSKATNVGATVSAISGLATGKNIILIAGGEAKGQSFEALNKAVKATCKQVILIGAAATEIADNLPSETAVVFADSMDAAVEMGASLAKPGDVVLLSPACASFDMFDNYQKRGDSFREAVLRLSDEVVS